MAKAKAKLIDGSSIGNSEELAKVSELAKSIRERNSLIVTETEKLEADKDEITGVSTKMFFKDIEDEDVPDLNGNHEYHTPDGELVTVNFRVLAGNMDTVNKQPADKYLRGQFGDDYVNLFDEKEEHELTADTDTILKQVSVTPDMFKLRLKELTPDQMVSLCETHPDLVEFVVTDLTRYASSYPSFVKTVKKVTVKKNFIDKVQALPGAVKQRVRGFLVSFLKPALTASVKCGNAAKSKK